MKINLLITSLFAHDRVDLFLNTNFVWNEDIDTCRYSNHSFCLMSNISPLIMKGHNNYTNKNL